MEENTSIGAEIGELSPRMKSSVASDVEKVRKKVPPIGTGWRWYDIPYRVLHHAVESPIGSLVPAPVTRCIEDVMEYLFAFHHLDEVKAGLFDSLHDNFEVPPGERIEQAAIWAIELFPPSQYANLRQSLEKNGWDKDSWSGVRSESLMTTVEKARSGWGSASTGLGTILAPDSPVFALHSRRGILPPEISSISLSLVHIGTGITALAAFAQLSPVGQKSLDESVIHVAWR